jgi:uncharacterized protein with HEPN domain
MQHDARKYLFDALSACDAIAEFTQRKSLDDYLDELILRSAVERQFEILGDAIQNHLPTLHKWLKRLNL